MKSRPNHRKRECEIGLHYRMGKNYVFGTFFAAVWLFQQVTSVIIVPAPAVLIESATSRNIILNWTMPIKELYDNFTVEVHAPGEEVRIMVLNTTRLEVENLTPGALYTFFVSAHRGDLTSDTRVIMQDTVPLPPSNLKLETFQSLVLSMEGIFGEVQFTLDVPGIKAVWEGPKVGICDCYVAAISPPDGRVARPEENLRVMPTCQETVCQAPPNATTSLLPRKPIPAERTFRQFIHLIPGQTYTVTVRSRTCGHGFLGALKSIPINKTITLPPSNPPPVVPKRVTNTSAYLSWEEGEIPGFYDNFEVIPLTSTSRPIRIHSSVDPRTRGRNVSGLFPCKTYNFEVYTLNKRQRSPDSKITELFTRPTPPHNLIVTNYDETSISVKWSYRPGNETAAFRLIVENLRALMRPASRTSAMIDRLTPGTLYTISVSTQCIGPGRVESNPVRISQITVPLPPTEISAQCAMMPKSDDDKAPITSLISLSWQPPQRGDWDGFVVDYSPFEFENAVSTPAPPIELPKNALDLNITVPVTKKTFTAFVRSTRQHVLSASISSDAKCRDSRGISARRCRIQSANFRIIIRMPNATHIYIEITGIQIQNITVELSDITDDIYVSTKNKFFIVNPCRVALDASRLNVIFYPLCDKGRYCRPITRKLCASLVSVRDEVYDESALALNKEPNACCNGRPFHTREQKCCHSKLAEASDSNSQCCYTRWYDRTRHKCCGRNDSGGIVRPVSKSCSP